MKMYYLIHNDKVIGTYFTLEKAKRFAKEAAIQYLDIVVVAEAVWATK